MRTQKVREGGQLDRDVLLGETDFLPKLTFFLFFFLFFANATNIPVWIVTFFPELRTVTSVGSEVIIPTCPCPHSVPLD